MQNEPNKNMDKDRLFRPHTLLIFYQSCPGVGVWLAACRIQFVRAALEVNGNPEADSWRRQEARQLKTTLRQKVINMSYFENLCLFLLKPLLYTERLFLC